MPALLFIISILKFRYEVIIAYIVDKAIGIKSLTIVR